MRFHLPDLYAGPSHQSLSDALFDSLDLDKNGTLDLQEMYKFFHEISRDDMIDILHTTFPSQYEFNKEKFRDLMRTFGVKELLEALETYGFFKKIFEVFDSNGDGYLAS